MYSPIQPLFPEGEKKPHATESLSEESDIKKSDDALEDYIKLHMVERSKLHPDPQNRHTQPLECLAL